MVCSLSVLSSVNRWHSLSKYKETFENEKLGSIRGKMDTGNSSKTSVIHSDTYEIKGKKINWELNGVKMISKL